MDKNNTNNVSVIDGQDDKLDMVEIIYNGERVITTERLAQYYETDVNNIQKNFSNNKEHFEEKLHYYYLEGAELKAFKNCLNGIQSVNKHTRNLYLWTHRGASRHCKLVGTKQAWQQFDVLEDIYFKKVNSNNLIDKNYDMNPYLKMFADNLQVLVDMDIKQRQLEAIFNRQQEELSVVDEKVDNFADILTLKNDNWRKESNKLINKMATVAGGTHYISAIRRDIYAEYGTPASKVEKLNVLDVIGADPKLIEGFNIIVKEKAIHYGIKLEEKGFPVAKKQFFLFHILKINKI